MGIDSQKLLTIQEAAALLSIKVSRLRTAVFRREIPFVKIGRLVRFKQEALIKWIDQMSTKTSSQKEKESWF